MLNDEKQMMIVRNDDFVFVWDHPSGVTVRIIVKRLLPINLWHGLLCNTVCIASALSSDVKSKMAGATRSKLAAKNRVKSPEAQSTPAKKKSKGRPKRNVNANKKLTSIQTQFNASQNDLQNEQNRSIERNETEDSTSIGLCI